MGQANQTCEIAFRKMKFSKTGPSLSSSGLADPVDWNIFFTGFVHGQPRGRALSFMTAVQRNKVVRFKSGTAQGHLRRPSIRDKACTTP